MRKKILFNSIWTAFLYAILLFVVIYFNIKYNNEFRNEDSVTTFEYVGWIVIESVGLLLVLILFIVSSLTIKYESISYKEKIIYSIVTLNFIRLYLAIKEAKFKNHLLYRWKKWKMIDYTLIAMAIAIYMILAVICKMLIPTVPQLFISLSLEYIAIFFIAYITQSFLKTFITGLACGLLLMLIPTTYFINFAQYLFDYLIPHLGVSIGAFIVFKTKKDNRNIFKWLSFIIFPYIIVYFSRVIAGVVFYGEFAWPGFPLWLYSFIINGLNTSVDFVVMMVFAPIILSRLWPLRDKYQTKWDI